jgi:hypothetical protein
MLLCAGLGVEEADRKRVWMDDAEQMRKKGLIATSRAILGHALAVFKGSPPLHTPLSCL